MNTTRHRGIASYVRDFLDLDTAYMSNRNIYHLVVDKWYFIYACQVLVDRGFLPSSESSQRSRGDVYLPISPHWHGISNT